MWRALLAGLARLRRSAVPAPLPAAPAPPEPPEPPAPEPPGDPWEEGIPEELKFWAEWLATGGLSWPDDFAFRLDPDAELQEHITEALPAMPGPVVRLLDVGAGPLTYPGKRWQGRKVEITAVDPLAGHYDELLARHGVTPLVRTQPGFAERLVEQFGENAFDVVHARNSIDHSRDPWLAIQQMVAVVKPGGVVYMLHGVREAEVQAYGGFHQWNLYSEAGEFLVGNRTLEVNVSRELAPVAEVEVQPFVRGWMVTLIRKRA